jgi:hypothetical protein
MSFEGKGLRLMVEHWPKKQCDNPSKRVRLPPTLFISMSRQEKDHAEK